MASCKFTLLQLLLLHYASARSFGGYAYPNGALYVGADEKVWIDAVAASNASGTYSMSGYDVSKPWPGEPVDGWTLTKAVIDLSHGYRDGVAIPVIASDMKIIAPKSLYVQSTNESDHGSPVVNAHPDWVFCGWRWYHPPYGNDSRATNPKNLDATPDGSCAEWLPEDCVKAVEEQARTAYYINSEPKGIYGARHTCYDIDVPDECKGTGLEGNDPVLPFWGVPLQYLNGSTTWQGGYIVENEDTEKDKQDMWKTLTQSYQPILTMFGRYNNDTEASVEPGFAKLSCIRAHEAKSSEKNEGSGGSDGNGGNSSNSSNGGGDSGNDGDGKRSAAALVVPWVIASAAFFTLANEMDTRPPSLSAN